MLNKGGKLTEDPNFCLSSETLRSVLGKKPRLAQDLLHSPGYPLTDSNASVSQVLRIQVIHGATYFSKRRTTTKPHKITSSFLVKIPTVWLPKTDLKKMTYQLTGQCGKISQGPAPDEELQATADL